MARRITHTAFTVVSQSDGIHGYFLFDFFDLRAVLPGRFAGGVWLADGGRLRGVATESLLEWRCDVSSFGFCQSSRSASPILLAASTRCS